jgi:hypothetical protein
MKGTVYPVIVLLLVGRTGELGAQSRMTHDGDYLVLERVRFADRMGFDRPVEAFSLLIPRGWQSDGGVKWRGLNECRSDIASNHVKAGAPDGSIQLEVLPSRSFVWTSDQMMMQALAAGAQNGGCQINQPFDAMQYIAGFARQDLGASASDIRIDESGMPALRALDQQANAVARQYGTDSEQSTTLALGTITFRDGTEGMAQVGVTNSILRRPDMMSGGVTVMTTTSVFHFAMIRYRPARKAEAARMFRTILSSHRTNPVWKQAKDQFLSRLGEMEHRGRLEKIRLMGEQSREYARAQGQAADARMRDWENRQTSQDKQHKQFVQAIREVETWKGAGGSVELAAGYDQAWSRGDGTYILSNKPGFDPNALFKDGGFTEMKRAD